EGLTASGATSTDAVETLPNTISGTAIVRDANNNDVTAQFTVKTKDGELKVDKREIKAEVADAEAVEYDGNEHTGVETVEFDNEATGQTATITYIPAKGTLVDTYTGTYGRDFQVKDAAGNDVTSNYTLVETKAGQLQITDRTNKYAITVVANSTTVDQYDGQYHSAEGFETLTFTVEGNTYTVSGLTTSDPGSVDATTLTNEISGTAVVKDKDGNIVTSQFTVNTQNGQLTIGKRKVTVTAVSKTKTYGDEDPELTAVVEGAVEIRTRGPVKTETIEYSLARAEGENVNNYAITVDPGKNLNYDVTVVDGTFIIEKKPITLTIDQKSKVYGDPDPEFTASFGEGDLVGDDKIDYTLTRTEGENAGTYEITTDIDNPNYIVKVVPANLSINPKAITITADSDTKVYDATALTKDSFTNTALAAGDSISATVTGSQTVVGESDNVPSDAIFTNANGEDVTASYAPTYINGLLKVTLNNELIITADSDTKVYDGTALTKNSYRVAGLAEGDHVDAVTVTGSQTAAGSSENVPSEARILNAADEDVTASYAINYRNGQLAVTPKAITLTVDAKAKTYGDEDPALTARFGANDLAVGDEIEIALAREAGENAGTYTITATAADPNYTITVVPAELTINKKEITLTVDAKAKTYGDEDPALTASFGEGDLVGEDTIDYTLTRAEGENTGAYTISTIIDDPNYDVTVVPAELTIDRKAITLTVDAKAKTYGDEDPEFTASFAEGDLVGEDTIDYTLARAEGENAGAYEISTVIDNPNYDVTVIPAELTINKKAITLTVDAASKTYGDEDPAFTASFGEGDLVGEDKIDYTLIREEGENAGTYQITTGIANDNYDVTVVPANLTIRRKAATITADSKTKTYGDSDPVLTAVVSGMARNDAAIYTLSREAGQNVGTYAINAAVQANPNYIFTVVPGTLTIGPKAVTVTPDNKVKTFGGEDPALTAVVTGLVNGDSADLISYTLEREGGEDAGEYAIRAAGEAAQGNYTVSFAEGAATIVPADTVIVRIAANNGSYQYDGIEKDLSGYTVTEISNDLYTEADFAFNGSSELKGTNAGIYRTAMQASDFENVNDNFSSVIFEVTNGELEITKRAVTMTSGDAAKDYDGNALMNTEITFTGDGFVAGEEPVITVTGRQTREGTSENTFVYALPANASEDNYDVTVVYGTLAVANSTGHHLIIRYVDEDGNELDKPFDRIYADGEAYNVSIPRKTGYNADQTKVAGVMNGADIEVTVKYSIAPYTLTVEFSSILDGTTAAHSLTLSHMSGEAYDLKIPAFDGYTPMVDRITGIMPSGNRTITVFMIPDGEDAEAVRRTYRDYDMMVIDDYGTALGAFNSVLGSGELAE
ncbi:MAG: MucBP domain-containing protein, partial [Clostridia bacterium]|nr:MucBP domain-containing protein [Clostridia bacterium]